jgi:hypothetical protein
LAAKLNEGWEMLQRQYFGSGLSRNYAPNLAQEAQEALKKLGRYFGAENVIRACRDQYAFHYDGNALRDHYRTLPAREDTDFFLCNFAGCNLFNVAESAAAHALLENIGEGNRERGIQTLVVEILTVSALFQDFTAGFASVFLDRIGAPAAERLEIGELPAYENMTLPFLCEGPAEAAI